MLRRILLVLLISASSVLADEVTLRNGDKLTGRISSTSGGVLTIQSPYFGTLTTPLSNVTGFVMDPRSAATTATVPTTRSSASAPATTTASTAPAPTPPAHTAPAPKRWSGSVSAAGAIARGNTDSEGVTISADATRKGDHNTFSLKGKYAFEEQKDKTSGDRFTTVDNWLGEAKLDQDLTERWYDYGLIRVERDNVAHLAVRVSPGVGAGYRWILKPEEHFNTEGGVNWIYEQYSNDGNNDHIAMRLAYHYDRKLNDKVSLVHNVEYLPNVADWGDYNLNVDAGLRALLTGTLFTEFKVVWQRDSTPAPGAQDDDLRYTLGMGFKF